MSIEINKQIIDFVEHFLRSSIGAIDLINDDNGRQVSF